MQTFTALAALAGVVAAQTVNPAATPSAVVSAQGAAPSGCSPSYSGLFQIQVVNATSASSARLAKRQAMSDDGGQLIVQLRNSILTSTRNATAYVAGGNHQFQFTTPSQNAQPQPGFIYDAGFTACANGTIAHGDTTIFYECNGGARNVIADINIYGDAVCYPIFLQIVPYSGGSGSAPASTATVTATTGAPGTATRASGGTTVTPATQSPDGQPGPGSSAVVRTTSVAIVTQISDNQPQAPRTGSAVRTSSPVAVLTQISDNQPQAPTAALTPYVTPTRGPVQYTGAANSLNGGSFFGLAAGAAALALL